jgi:transposase
MPGIGVRTEARILLEIGEPRNFASSGHVAAYADIALVTRSSGSSIKGKRPRTRTSVILAAFGALPSGNVTRGRSTMPR